MWKLSNTLLNNQWIEEEIEREIKFPETNENGNTTYQNLQDAAKAVLSGKFVAINAYIKKQEGPQASSLTLHLKNLEKKELSPKLAKERR